LRTHYDALHACPRAASWRVARPLLCLRGREKHHRGVTGGFWMAASRGQCTAHALHMRELAALEQVGGGCFC
jgi:hypothetical protein